MNDKLGAPLALPRSRGIQCSVTEGGTACALLHEQHDQTNALNCPQLPPTTPTSLAAGQTWNNPPLEWTCLPELYFELDGVNPSTAVCHCGCGVIDPDCGYELSSCQDQSWNPQYVGLQCEGELVATDLFFCRLESSTCHSLPPGLARGATSPWTCIPDVYNELSDPGTSLNDCDCMWCVGVGGRGLRCGVRLSAHVAFSADGGAA